jgi:triosephosphate isomerase
MEKVKSNKFMFCTSWKMNLSVSEEIEYARDLVSFIDSGIENIDRLEIFIFPDFLSLHPVSEIVRNTGLKFGAQDCFWEDRGAFTGEVSPLFLKEIGCNYVIIGHPERVIQVKEDSEMINRKIKAVLKNDMDPLLLVYQRKEYTNPGQAFKIIGEELLSKIEGIAPPEMSRIIIVFEPLWAIGTGKTTSAEHIAEVASGLRELLDSEFGRGTGSKQRLMYGGGVTLENIDGIINLKDIDGIGMGRAAINFSVFKNAILSIVKNKKF